MGPQWLALSGASRSGTTFLNALLNTHPNVAIFTETGIENLTDLVRASLTTGRIAYDSRHPAMPAVPSRDSVDAVAKLIFELRFNKKNIKIMGDKMPNINDEICDRYLATVGRLRRIYIVRRPTDVIASSLHRRDNARMGADVWHVADVQEAIVEWALNWEHVARSHGDPDVLVVSYERFDLDAGAEIERIAEFLHIDRAGFASDVFAPGSAGRHVLDLEETRLVEDVLGPVEALLPRSLEEGLGLVPLIYPRIALGMEVQTSRKWPCAALFFKSGFSLLEDWGIWTDGHDASFGFRLDPGIGLVTVSLYFTAFMGNRSYFELYVRAGSQDTYRLFRIDNSVNRTTVVVPCRPARDGTVELHLHMPFVKGDTEEPVIEPRSLGIGLLSFQARQVSQAVCKEGAFSRVKVPA